MIMMGDRRKILTQIMGPSEKDKTEGEAPLSEYHAIAQDLLDAVKSGDVESVADALKAFFSACGAESEPTEGG